VPAEPTDEVELRRDRPGPGDTLRWAGGEGAAELFLELRLVGIGDLREVELWLLFSLACLQS